MRFLKKLLLVVILLIVVIALALTALCFFMNPNKLKPILAEEVRQQTGYETIIDGRLSWRIYPVFGIKVDHMAFKEPGKEVFADLNNIFFEANFKDVIQGQKKLSGNIYISSMSWMNLKIEKINVHVNWQNNILNLKPFKGEMYSGIIQGEAHGKNFAHLPHWEGSFDLNNVQLKPLLNDLSKGNSKLNLEGAGHINMLASTQGKTKEQLLNNLYSTLQFSVNKGIVDGINLNYLIKSAEAVASKQPVPMPDNLNQTQFESFTGSAIIKNGILNTDNLILLSSDFTTNGQGQINLLAKTYDLHLQVSILSPNQFKLAVPIAITGPLNNPFVRLDAGQFKVELTKEQLEKVKTKVKEEVKKLPEKADKFLKKLIGE